MQIWLPPSEGKRAPMTGPVLDLEALAFPSLAGPRREVIAALAELGDGPEAARVLKLGAKSAEDARLNADLLGAACAPAIQVYTGVLFSALDAGKFGEAESLKFEEMTLIASGLFGFVRPADLIPNHRLAIGVNLPTLGPLATWWKPRLVEALGDLSGKVIFDARSGAYRAMAPALEASVVQLGVVQEASDRRKVITHMAKQWRGLAATHLICDEQVGVDAGVPEVLGSLEEMARESSAMMLEVEEPSRTSVGGAVVKATLVLVEK